MLDPEVWKREMIHLLLDEISAVLVLKGMTAVSDLKDSRHTIRENSDSGIVQQDSSHVEDILSILESLQYCIHFS